MKYNLFFPQAVEHNGLFKQRSAVIDHYYQKHAGDKYFHYNNSPNTEELYKYFQLIKKNSHSKEYLGEIFTDDNSWKFLSASNDLKNFYDGMNYILDNNIKHAYFMTNSAGHHADNKRYQLFCPLNHLFFLVEILNYHTNFPDIFWIDIDAHFGDGDKAIFDNYKIKMRSETNNLSGVSIHNDANSFQENDYQAINYEKDIGEGEFIKILENISIDNEPRFILLFFGTDIFKGDYGSNQSLSTKIIPQIIKHFENVAEKTNASLIIIQTGGSIYENITALIDQISER